MTPSIGPPIDVRHLFRPLDAALISLLHSLNTEDWHRPTVARLWSVKDVAAHLLDGNIRLLSIQRDRRHSGCSYTGAEALAYFFLYSCRERPVRRRKIDRNAF